VSDEDDLLIRFAGAGAEVIFRKVSWTMAFRSAAGGDWKASQEVIDELALLEPRKQVVKKAKARVIALLTEQWENVLAVAAALRDRRRLSGGELQQIVGSAGKSRALIKVISPPKINIPLPEAQQSPVINLVGQKDAILDGVDHPLSLTTPRSRVSRQSQARDDRGCQHQNPAVLLSCSR